MMAVTGGASFKINRSNAMQLPICSSRLAANTPGLAFAFAVSVVARYIQHDFGLGGVQESPKTLAKKFYLYINLQGSLKCPEAFLFRPLA